MPSIHISCRLGRLPTCARKADPEEEQKPASPFAGLFGTLSVYRLLQTNVLHVPRGMLSSVQEVGRPAHSSFTAEE